MDSKILHWECIRICCHAFLAENDQTLSLQASLLLGSFGEAVPGPPRKRAVVGIFRRGRTLCTFELVNNFKAWLSKLSTCLYF